MEKLSLHSSLSMSCHENILAATAPRPGFLAKHGVHAVIFAGETKPLHFGDSVRRSPTLCGNSYKCARDACATAACGTVDQYGFFGIVNQESFEHPALIGAYSSVTGQR